MSLWSVVGGVINGAASLFGASKAADANVEAANIYAQSADKQAEAIREGNQLAQERYDQLMEIGKPGISHLREVTLTDPYELTPGQKTSLDDIRRQTTNVLNNSGLRGAGRSITAAIKDVENDARGKFIDANIGRRDNAAAGLTGQYGAGVSGGAQTAINAGNATGNAALAGGTANANANTANAGLWGAAIGDVAGIVASELKSMDRESRYADNVKKLTSGGDASLGG